MNYTEKVRQLGATLYLPLKKTAAKANNISKGDLVEYSIQKVIKQTDNREWSTWTY